MKILLAIICSAALLAVAAPALGAPQRIVSLNMCADQYLIALADRDQIAALSEWARDPAMSYQSEAARSYPVATGAAEAVMSLKPDLVIVNRFRRQETQSILKPYGYPTIELRPARTFEDIVDQTREIAAAIGHPERGEALIARMRAELAAIPAPRGRAPVVAHYQRRGFVTGTGTLLDEIMTRAGADNLARSLGRSAVSRITLEEILTARPDYLLYTEQPAPGTDMGTDLLLHPALMERYAPSRRLYVPQALTMCGGPSFPEAVRVLHRQLHS